ncbi:hypothetical protein H9L10_04830 [Phycicoccus endophyticus]|uniref:Uncharacterized protein n=1 Tax=Phycicoccus endophyticus TaxID=1690220 RepID=A0A7G9R430_9MICO|nr:hypothetical protein [Phycicoccus endophyticus]NHI18197.1 hypothetical protein [Phycicoccus endophyticus]QNN50355.1 hypothetical protein H9L10_04830 [Phycicoccus endophyticus]GGL25707.1 hypothetical protein GCM10012283_04800 [Phycicoccus endophyticus]
MSAEARSGAGHGLLLVRRSPAAVTRWLRQGLVAATVAPLGAWTGVTVAERAARSAAPYDVGLEVLAARPVPRRGRPAIGLFDLGGRAVVTLQPRGLRHRQHWVVWQPRTGVVQTPSLPRLGLPMLLSAARAGSTARAEDVAGVLRSGEGEPLDVLLTLLGMLHLPGEDLLVRGDSAGASDIEPAARGVAAFDRLVADEARHRAEWEAAWGGRPPGDRELR